MLAARQECEQQSGLWVQGGSRANRKLIVKRLIGRQCVNATTGKMEPWKKFGEGLPSGASAYGALFSADGSAYAYGYVQTLSGGLGGEGIEVGQAYLEKHEMISSGVSPVVVP